MSDMNDAEAKRIAEKLMRDCEEAHTRLQDLLVRCTEEFGMEPASVYAALDSAKFLVDHAADFARETAKGNPVATQAVEQNAELRAMLVSKMTTRMVEVIEASGAKVSVGMRMDFHYPPIRVNSSGGDA